MCVKAQMTIEQNKSCCFLLSNGSDFILIVTILGLFSYTWAQQELQITSQLGLKVRTDWE